VSDAPRPDSLDALVTRVLAAARARGRARPAARPTRLADYQARLAGARELVLTAETALELGSPRRRSAHAVLWTATPGVVTDDQLVVVGPDLDPRGGGDRAYVQLTLVEVAPDAARDEPRGAGGSALVARLEAQQFLTRQLPGVMARLLPGRLWLRVSRDALAAGLDFALLAAALRRACRTVAPAVRAVACVFASGADDDVADLAALAAEARVHAGRHHRLALGGDGAFECADLDCATCDDRPVCDRIRAATAIRRREPTARPAAPVGGAA
jgi:hypothetical protein